MTSIAAMLGLGWPELLVIAGFVLIVLEITSPAFIYLGFAVGAFATAGLVALYNPGLPIVIAAFSVISLLAFLLMRRLFRKPGDTHVNDSDINHY